MEKFENVDVLKTLEGIMRLNTASFQSDFDTDEIALWGNIHHGEPGDNTFLWLSRSCGTELFHEQDVFFRDTYPFDCWQYYGGQGRDRILAYAVEITGHEDSTILGNVFPLSYQDHWKRVRDDAVKPDAMRVIFQSGEAHTFPFEIYNREFRQIQEFHGAVKSVAPMLNKPECMAEILEPYRAARAAAVPAKLASHLSALRKDNVQREAERLLCELKKPYTPNSPGKNHFMAKVSPYFLGVANSKDQSGLFKLLPFKSLMLTDLKDRDGLYALISKDEDRNQALRKPSVREKLKGQPDAPKPPAKPRAKRQER